MRNIDVSSYSTEIEFSRRATLTFSTSFQSRFFGLQNIVKRSWHTVGFLTDAKDDFSPISVHGVRAVCPLCFMLENH